MTRATTRTTADSEQKPGGGSDPRSKPGRTSDRRFAWMMVGPAVAILFLVTIAPLLFSLGVSFTNLQFSSPQPMRWVGIDNYVTLVTHDVRFQGAFLRTLLLVAIGVLTQSVIGYIIASLLSRVRRNRALLLSPI